MKSKTLRKEILLIAVLSMLSFPLAFAADNSIKRTRGNVEIVDFDKGFFVVNESTYFWNDNTIITDAKGAPMKVGQLKPKTPVYVEWKTGKRTIDRVAKKVCIYKIIE